MSAHPRRRRRIGIALAAVMVLIVGSVVAVTVARQHRSGHDIDDATFSDVVAAVDAQLELEPVRMTGALSDADGGVSVVDATVDPAGAAAIHLSTSGGGEADVAAGGERVLVRGNVAFWLSLRPSDATDRADQWIDAGSDPTLAASIGHLLAPARLAEELAAVPADGWRRGETVDLDGTSATSFTADGIEILVAADRPHRLLGVHTHHRPAGPEGFRTPAATAQGAAEPPPLSLGIGSPERPELDSTRRRVDETLRQNPAPPSLDTPIARPIVDVVATPTANPCLTPTCAVLFVVRNIGDAALEGARLMATVNGSSRTEPVPTLAPGAAAEFLLPYPNTSRPGGPLLTATHVGFVVAPSLGDVKPRLLAQAARQGIDPNAAIDGNPINAPMLEVATALTADLTTPERRAQFGPGAVELLQQSIPNFLPALHGIVTSDRVRNPEQLRDWLLSVPQRLRRRQVELVYALTEVGHDVTIGAVPGAPGIVDESTGQRLGEPDTAPSRARAPDLPLPPFRGKKTTGIFVTPDGTETLLVSGKLGPGHFGLSEPGNGMTVITHTHVEAHAGALMRAGGITEATLFINRAPCGTADKFGCEWMLTQMIPRGSRIFVYVMEEGSVGPLPRPHLVEGIG